MSEIRGDVVVLRRLGRECASLPVPRSTVNAHIFSESFAERMASVVYERDVDRLFAWLSEVLDERSSLRPPQEVALAIPALLQERACTRGFREDAAPVIAAIERRVTAAYRGRPASVAATVDERDAAIDRLLARMSGTDALTAEHSRAVGAWCLRIARALGYGEEDAVEFSRAGLVHDIGKMQVPLDILTAPRTLDEREWEVMRAHVVRGDEIAARSTVLAAYRAGIKQHHERLDGSGYPNGARGSEIALQARIVAVADAFNAMIGRRPYRQSRTPEEALAIVMEERGRGFDADVVEALARVLGA